MPIFSLHDRAELLFLYSNFTRQILNDIRKQNTKDNGKVLIAKIQANLCAFFLHGPQLFLHLNCFCVDFTSFCNLI